jgi:hypothetical protein
MTVCPDCGGRLQPVAAKTVKHILRYDVVRGLDPGVFGHCPNHTCDVVYVQCPRCGAEAACEVFRRRDVKEHLRPFAHGHDRLVCYCFGYTQGDIEDNAREGEDAVPSAISAQVAAGDCACEVMNPKGG